MKRLRRPVSEEDIEVWRTELNDHLIHALECKAGGVNFYPEKLFADSLEVVATLRERIAELKSRLKEQAQLKQIPSKGEIGAAILSGEWLDDKVDAVYNLLTGKGE